MSGEYQIHTSDCVIIDNNNKHSLNHQGLSLLFLFDLELFRSESLRSHLNFTDCHTMTLIDKKLLMVGSF